MELRLLTEQPSYLLPLVHASLASKRTRTIFSCTVPRCYQRGEQERPRENRAKNPKSEKQKNKKKRKGKEAISRARETRRYRMDEEEWRKRDETASISKSNYLFPTWCDIGTADRKTRGSADGSTVSSGLVEAMDCFG